MPELPEVETIVRNYGPLLIGHRIAEFHAEWPRQVVPNPATVRDAIVGRRIETVARRGKFIVVTLDDAGVLLVHLRMSGRFEWAAEGAPPSHVRAVWSLDDGRRLLFCDARKFGRIVHTREPSLWLAGLGPEPLADAFTATVLGAALRGRTRPVKPLLLDQTVVAGLGNIYTDEALYRARVHPLRRADTLTHAEVGRLHAAIRAVLEDGVLHNGTTIDWIYPGGQMQQYLRVYGRDGEPCPCGATIERLVVAQRGTHVCPVCQPRPPGTRRKAG